ncbi:MAG: ABC transporter ATP-binding protein [Thermoplasmata archaeon]
MLRVEHLTVDYAVGAGTFRALNDVSLELLPGRVVGVVGETGCGKSTLGHSIPRLLPEPPAKVRAGKIIFQGTDLLKIPKWRMPGVRGTGIGMIFQEPINSLNPAFKVGDQIAESVRIRKMREHGVTPVVKPEVKGFDYSKRELPKAADVVTGPFLPPNVSQTLKARGVPMTKEIHKEVLDFLRLVRINDPERIVNLFPHELSGGMRQRIMIAMALSGKPALLIADEPTSALDVTIQAQVLTLMKELMEEVRTSILFISHDLGVIAEMADDVGVMYAGHMVEFGPVAEIFDSPQHPYTKALLRSIPNKYKDEGVLPSLSGSVPNLSHLPDGCSFNPRCPLARDVCRKKPEPALVAVPPGPLGLVHKSACFFPEEVPMMP